LKGSDDGKTEKRKGWSKKRLGNTEGEKVNIKATVSEAVGVFAGFLICAGLGSGLVVLKVMEAVGLKAPKPEGWTDADL